MTPDTSLILLGVACLVLAAILNSHKKPEPTGLQTLAPRQFERYCAAWLVERGFRCELTPACGDGNVDILIYSGNALVAIGECKRWQKKVGARPLKVLYATMMQNHVFRGYFFGLGGFSLGALEYLASIPQPYSIELVSKDDLTSK